jgi:beta-glucosidase
MQQQQLEILLGKMTLDEKIGQLVQLDGAFFSDKSEERTGPMSSLGITDKELVNVGTVLNIAGAAECRHIQNSVMSRHRLHVPTMFMADVIHGYQTIFPIPLALGSAWNTEAVRNMAQVSARESSVAGLSLTFSPMVDLVRDPRWGRVMEATGEDPYLNARLAEAMVQGYQGDDLLNDTDRVAACVKHFAAYGAPVAGREYNTVNMSERQLREMYLPGYHAAINAGAKTVMTSFNTVDGIPATGNKHLLRDILRDEWGFDGAVISDFNAIKELENHGVAEDDRAAASMALEAGVDIEMMNLCYLRELPGLVESGRISESLINEAVMRVLNLKNDLGLFEHPYRGADEVRERNVIFGDEHRSAARTVADQSIVLLKNNGAILPFADYNDECIESDGSFESVTSDESGTSYVPAADVSAAIALAGPFALSHDVLGSWSFHGRQQDSVSLADGMRAFSGNRLLVAREYCDYFNPSAAAIEEAVDLAQQADTIVLALGESSQMTGEAASRTDIRLPQAQIDLFNAVHAVNERIVVVLFNGRPLDLSAIDDAQAIVEAWFLGSDSGNAVADVLFGSVNPSGRLSMSFPSNVGQIPVYYNGDNTGRPYESAPDEKYVSQYIDCGNDPKYPFGFGLSYSSFTYDGPTVTGMVDDLQECAHGCSDASITRVTRADVLDMPKFDVEHPLTIHVDVTNTSDVDGIETVQLYVRDLIGEVVRPVKELKGFSQVFVHAHESVTVNFTLDESAVRYVHPDLRVSSDLGEFDIMVGPNSRDLSAPIRVRLV